jgi:LysR family glycine cleavage system transcriptional activator
MRQLPPLPSVRVFEAAARHENFTTAAAELGMTQAAVSYQIKLLEERLGVPLFLRSKRRVTLSEAGRRIAPQISVAFDTISEAFAAVVDQDEGVLAISTTQTFAVNWMAPRLGAFQLARPELAVRLQTENALVDFARDEIDVAVRAGSGGWPGLRHHFLFRAMGAVMCSPDFRDRHRLERPEQVAQIPRLTPSDSFWDLWFTQSGLAAPEGEARRGVRLDSQVAEGNAAMAGHGIAILNPVLWRNELASGRLVAPFPVCVDEGTGYWLVYPEHKRAQAKIRTFRDWILAEVAEQARSGPAAAFVEPDRD